MPRPIVRRTSPSLSCTDHYDMNVRKDKLVTIHHPRAKAILCLASAISATALAVMPAEGSDAPGKEPISKVAESAADRRALALERAATRLSQVAEARNALGSYYDAATRQFVLVNPSAGGSSATLADVKAIGFPGRIESRNLTKQAVEGVNKEFEQRTFHPGAANYTYASYLDVARGVVVLDTDAPRDVVAPVLNKFPGAVEYRESTVQRDSRRNDSTPHWGGASITSGGATCSSGFAVQNGSGTRFMVTAAHCFPQDATVFSPEGGWNWGTVVNRGPFPEWDMELIGNSTYGSFIYVGDSTGTASHVINAGDPVVGFTGYCRSGQTSFQQCGSRVDSLFGQLCDSSGCTYGLIAYTGGGASQGGDSGAPYYLPGSSGVYIRGLHVGRSSSGTMYAEKWSSVSSHFGVSIVT